MLEKIYVVTDLGPGDGGKGSIINALAWQNEHISIVIKRGGAQDSHKVVNDYGYSFNFSQWGCGTFDTIPTFLSKQMVISPIALGNEAYQLTKKGISKPFRLLYADPNCICATPYHKISSQLEELRLGKNPRGTVGTGVGKAYNMHNNFGKEMTIYAHELKNRFAIRKKLQLQIEYYRDLYEDFPTDNGCPEDAKLIQENLDLLFRNNANLPFITEAFENIGRLLRLKSLSRILRAPFADVGSAAIVESSHGVLTDADTGIKPHVSAIRTLPKFTTEMLRNAGYPGEIINLAVHRAYEYRHGAGPMPTYDADFTKKILPGSDQETNRWQGDVRAGPLDLNLLRYALAAAGDTEFDGLCLTCFDQIQTAGSWRICTSYRNQPNLGEPYADFFKRAEPIVTDYLIEPSFLSQPIFDKVGEILLNHRIHVPLAILSFGPTEMSKIISEKLKRSFWK